MIGLAALAMAQSVESNPEAMVRAAVAANDAAAAAWQATVISLMVLVGILIIGAVMMFMAFHFKELVRNTDGMREELILATRKLALLEGNILGRAEQKDETAGLK
jgi:hypothetical protein